MPNTDISDILKNGDNFQLKPFDLSSKKTSKRFLSVKQMQNIARSRKHLDYKIMEMIFRGSNYYSAQTINSEKGRTQYTNSEKYRNI